MTWHPCFMQSASPSVEASVDKVCFGSALRTAECSGQRAGKLNSRDFWGEGKSLTVDLELFGVDRLGCQN